MKRIDIYTMILPLIMVIFLIPAGVTGQVSFTQTTTADFNKGFLNNVVASGDNLYLQTAASDPGTWLTTTVLPQTLSGHKTVSWNDRYVYVVGGYNNTTYSSAVYYATIDPVNGIPGGWTSLNSLPVAVKDPAVTIGTNTIYVLGGRDGSQVYNKIYYASINTDGTIGSWQTSSVNLPVGLWGHQAVYLNGYIYISGGASLMTETHAISNVYYAKVKADNTLSTFSNGTSLPATRNKHTMVTYNSKLYVMGGYQNGGTKANSVYLATPGVDGTTGAWSSATNMPVAVSNHSAVVTNGLFVVMAGAVGSTLSNTVYYASADASPLVWSTSPNVMYDYTKDGAAFQGNGVIFYTGGTNLSGTPIFNCRYSKLNLTSNFVNHGVFISNPFYELGADRVIDSLTFHSVFDPGFANCQVSYRTALSSDGNWSNWTALTSSSPIIVSLTRRYLQYRVIFTGQTTYNSTFQDMNLYTPGTQLCGNLNAITTFTKAASPYWATCDIAFTSGTHTFQAGATVLFLPGTGMTVSQASIVCNGVVGDSVKFLYFTNETGQWDGIYFDPNSDNGVSSQFYYTVIGNAGYGSNNANLYCNGSNEPLLSRCHIRGADGNGIRLNAAHLNIQNTTVRGNTENGFYLENSNPTLVSTTISYNGGAGVYLSSTSSVPNFSTSTTTIDHNLYGLRYPSPNFSLSQPSGSPILTANTYNGICIDGGDITGASRRWNSITYDYILLGTVRIIQYGGQVRLTIEPGNTIKVMPGSQIQIGDNSNGGELYALGTVDSLITFTAWNGLSGGWNGIYFHENSDNYGGQSQLDYCVIEKGNDYNYYSVNTSQPNVINNSKIQNAVTDGARYSNAYGSITNCQFLNNGRYPLYYLNPEAYPVHTGNTYTGNGINRIALSGGTYTSINRTYTNDGIPYYVLNDIFLSTYSSHYRMTIDPGVIMEFAPGTKLQVGSSSNGGDLYAQGTALSPIVFKAYNDSPGGWNGIYFTNWSDSYGSTSILEYCTIKQGATYNIYCENTTQPTMNNCIISNSNLHGMQEYNSSPQIHNCQFMNNNGYPLKYNDWSCNSHLSGNSYSGNNPDYIALSGGDYDANRTLYYDGIPYHVLGNIRIRSYSNHPRITVEPGVTLEFDPGLSIQVGASSDGGDLYAQGTSGSPVTFKAFNDTPGGWNGIFFTDWSDSYGSSSVLEYCTIKQGATYNIYCENTSQPTLENCVISNSALHGIQEYNSNPQIHNCQFLNNNGYPLKYNDWRCNSHLLGNTYSGNNPNCIALSGGDYDANRTIYNDGISYHILGNIRIIAYSSHPRITVKPGVTLLFDPGLSIQIGGSGSNGGDLYAEGTADSMITFKPYNNTAGGWGGLNFTNYSNSYGSSSSLKYCRIEKGANYNVYCNSVPQPTFDHCILTGSLLHGLHLSSASPVIKNSTFNYNTGYGIYLEGTSSPTVGNSLAYTCNLFNNGTYDVYNNGTSNVNARYNYWGSGDSAMIASRIYDKYDNTAKGIVYFGDFAQLPAVTSPSMILSGTVKYANTAGTPMKNAAMTIKDFTGATVASTSTNTAGNYTFTSLPSGYYRMTITPADPWGGVNPTDALGILNHFVQISPLTGMKLAAADVNVSHSVNATDALFVMKRYSFMISSFPSGDYLYHSDTIFMNGNNVTNNIEMLCFGDVNSSYVPGSKSSSMPFVTDGGVLTVPSYTGFRLPVRVSFREPAGAIGFGFEYPEEYLEITGVEIPENTSEIFWSAVNGIFRMAWANVNSVTPAGDGTIILVKMKSKDLSGLAGNINLNVNTCEFADPMARVIENVTVEIPSIAHQALGVEGSAAARSIAVYPNPARDKANISFSLEKQSRVKLNLYDMTGNCVFTSEEKSYPSGNQVLELNVEHLVPGIYLLKMEWIESSSSSSSLVRVVVSH